MSTTGSEVRGKAGRDLPGRAGLVQGWNAGSFLGEKGKARTLVARKGRRSSFTSVWRFCLSLKSSMEQLSGSCCKVGMGHSWTAPGQAWLSASTL